MIKAFFLSSGSIFPLTGGRRLREFQILKELSRHLPVRAMCVVNPGEPLPTHPTGKLIEDGFEVEFSFHHADQASLWREPIERFKPHFAKEFSQDLLKRLKKDASPGDVLWASRLRMAAYIPHAKKLGLRTVLEEHQIESDVLLDEAFEDIRSWRDAIRAIQCARYEKKLTEVAEVVVTASLMDATRVSRISPNSRIQTIPFHLPISEYKYAPCATDSENSRKRIVFIADTDYGPNLQATAWVIEEVFPRLSQALGQKPEFWIATWQKSSHWMDLFRGHIELKLYRSPDELLAILHECEAVLFPLREGRGSRIHVLEAMASGIPVVSTGRSVDGLTVRPSYDLFIANDADSITSQLLRLFRDPSLRRQTGANARETLETTYSAENHSQPMGEILRSFQVHTR